MTLVSALKELKSKGITKLVGMAGITDIDTYLEHATENHQNAVKYAAKGIQTWQDALDHENDNYIIELSDGHHIIATHYGTFDMATYSDYSTEEEMNMVFDNWKIAKEAEEIAENKIKQGNELSRETWKVIATMELVSAYKNASDAFEREFKNA